MNTWENKLIRKIFLINTKKGLHVSFNKCEEVSKIQQYKQELQ